MDKFYVGAKVLRINGSGLITQKGNIYEIEGIKKCKCGKVIIDLGFVIPHDKQLVCSTCKNTLGTYGMIDYCDPVNFRLIEPKTELLEIELNELLDEMNMEKTAMQSLVEELEERRSNCKTMYGQEFFEAFISIATKYLPAERKQIEEAFENGYCDNTMQPQQLTATDRTRNDTYKSR